VANLNVEKRLTRIERDLAVVTQHAANHRGLDKEQAWRIENMACSIAQDAARLGALARIVRGDRSGPGLLKRVRKALGFVA
jgi:hypothetical protein